MLLVLALGCAGGGPTSRTPDPAHTDEHRAPQVAIFAQYRKICDLATAARGLLLTAAARHAAGARSGVRRARANVGTTQSCTHTERTEGFKSRFLHGWSWGGGGVGKMEVRVGSGNRSGLVVRGEGSAARTYRLEKVDSVDENCFLAASCSLSS